jgi:hypothetical protein
MEKLILQYLPSKSRNSNVSKQEFMDFQKALLGNDVDSVDTLLEKYGLLGGVVSEAPVGDDAGDMFSMEADSGGDQSAPVMEMPVLSAPAPAAAAAKSGSSLAPKEAALARRSYQLKPAVSPKDAAMVRRSYQLKPGSLSPKENALVRRGWQLSTATRLSPKDSAILRRSYQLPKKSPKEDARDRRFWQLPKKSPKENARDRRMWQLPKKPPRQDARDRRSWQLA